MRIAEIIRPCAVAAAVLLAGCADGAGGIVGPGPRPERFTDLSLEGVAHGGGRFVAVGTAQEVEGDALVMGTERMLAAVSDDGETWRRAPLSLPGALTGVAHGNGVFVAVGVTAFEGMPAAVLRSADGEGWQPVAGAPALVSVAFGNGRFVGVGVDRAARRGVVVSSPDGAAWRTEAEIPGLAWPRVAFGGGTFVVWTEGGAVGSSADGAEWSWTAVPRVNTLFAVAWANGRFVASGTHDCCFGEVPSAIAYFTATSPDGRAWETRDAPLRTIFFDLAFAEGVYLASSYEQIFSSVDGTAWTPRRSAAARKDWRYALAFAEGKWVAVGRSAIDVSADGTAWRTLPIP